MPDTLFIEGVVATEPRHTVTSEGLAITSFRLASAQRRFVKQSQTWETADTNWYTVTAFRSLALNAAKSIAKSDRVLVTGRLRIRPWNTGEKSGTTVEIDADSLGHDLSWGTTVFTRAISASGPAPSPSEGFLPTSAGGGGGGVAGDQDAWAEATAPLVASA